MNLYINKISTLAIVGVISFLSTFQTLTNADAALTAPASWDYKYTKEASFYEYKLSDTTGPILTPAYTRTTDGAYHNYQTTFTVVSGLQITQIFNRSNTSWIGGGSTYYPIDTKIGSDASVGYLTKEYLKFDNQTSSDYYLYLDKSSNSGFLNYTFLLNGREFINTSNGLYMHVVTSLFMRLVIPSYSTFEMIADNSSALYTDAWYLEDLGVSVSYIEGYDIGEVDGYSDGLNNNPNILLNGFQAMVGILVNFALLILNLEAFGVSILSVFGVIAFFVGIIWFFKILRG